MSASRVYNGKWGSGLGESEIGCDVREFGGDRQESHTRITEMRPMSKREMSTVVCNPIGWKKLVALFEGST